MALAYWIMDDGSKQGKGLHLNCYAFNQASLELLLEALRTKYSLTCNIHNHKAGKRIYIQAESMPALRDLVRPYFVPSMLYKLGL